MKSRLIVVAIISLLAVAGIRMGVRRAQAQTATPIPYPFVLQPLTLGMVGLAPGQTARLYALNLQGIPAARVNLPPCNVTLSFIDDQGATLKTAAMNIDPGKAVHLDLAHDDVTRDSTRLQIRGVVQQTATPTPPPFATGALPLVLGCQATPTLEIFDNTTGATAAVLESAKGGLTIVPVVTATPPTP
jgi:hypothetical protein